MNRKKFIPWIIGGMLTVAVAGAGIITAVGNAAEKPAQNQACQDMMNYDADAPGAAGMMNDPDMEKQCTGMMAQPGMQQDMKETMQQPHMQASMKAMMQQDAKFHQMMLDLVNSVEAPENHDHGAETDEPAASEDEHAKHHG